MERPRNLRARCQAGKGSDPAWYVIHRKLSIYITWIFLRAGVPTTTVSLAMMASGFVGAVLLIPSGWPWNLTGFLFLYGAFLLDKADGEIARYRGVQTVHGILLDRFHHRLVEPCVYLAVALHEMQAGAPSILLAVGLATALLANVIEEHQQLPPFILIKHLRETGHVPKLRTAHRSEEVWVQLASLMRPLKLFRTFIIAVPAFALCYAAERFTGRLIPAAYLAISGVGLLIYVAFQSVYYFHAHLDSDIAAILERFPGLMTDHLPPHGVAESVNRLASDRVEVPKSRQAVQSLRERTLSELADHALPARIADKS